MTTPTFRYGDIKKLMENVVHKLDEAGYSKEASAMVSLTHIIACRVESPDISTKWGLEYMLECIEHHNSIIEYINNGGIDGNSQT